MDFACRLVFLSNIVKQAGLFLLNEDIFVYKHKEGLRTLAESLVQITCNDYTNFLILADFTI